MVTEQEVIDQLTRYFHELEKTIPNQRPRWDLQSLRRYRSRAWTMQLLATAALLLLMIGFGVLIHQARILTPTNPVTTPDPTIRAYKAMLSSDEQTLSSSSGIIEQFASPYDCDCPDVIEGIRNAAQHWLDDLAASTPPQRFAVIEAELRRNLGRVISETNDFLLALKTNDQKSIDLHRNLALIENQVVQDEGFDMAHATLGTASTFSSAASSQLSALQMCSTCQLALSQSDTSCTADIAQCIISLETFQAAIDDAQSHLVRPYAPASLAATAAKVQNDLTKADAYLDKMVAVLNSPSTAAPGSLASSHKALKSAFARFISDIKSLPS